MVVIWSVIDRYKVHIVFADPKNSDITTLQGLCKDLKRLCNDVIPTEKLEMKAFVLVVLVHGRHIVCTRSDDLATTKPGSKNNRLSTDIKKTTYRLRNDHHRPSLSALIF